MAYDTDDPDLYPAVDEFQDVYQTPSKPPAVDPSTLVSLQVPYVGRPTSQPTGGMIPEATADANTSQIIAEEDKDPVPKRTRLPRGKGQLREGRRKAQATTSELCSLVKVWKGLKKAPTIEKPLSEVAEYIPTAQEVMQQIPSQLGN